MIKIGIIGFGYVGQAMHRFFKDHYKVLVYDPHITTNEHPILMASKEEINQCELAIVCVPTPDSEDGADISIVEEVVSWCESPLILLKSTVPPGTTDYLQLEYSKRIVFSPEYCGESSYWTPYKFHTDIKETPFFIFGGSPEDTSEVIDYFLPVTGPVKTYRQTSARSAEMAKYMENSFYATKITFCYEIAEICKALDIDYNEARELWLLDPRINPMHTAVFKKNKNPFSGKCLPKDINALVKVAEKNWYYPNFLKEVIRSNERIGDKRVSELS